MIKAANWQDAISKIAPYVVKISTPNGWGTGFLVSNSQSAHLVGIATAAHVINQAHYWEQPIRIDHLSSGQTILLRHTDRAITVNEHKDTASIVFPTQLKHFPFVALNLSPEGMHLKIGTEVGWLGYPNISPSDTCFFSGRISAWLEKNDAYLVDGVAINGVSGGPGFIYEGGRDGGIDLIGLVSAYIPNMATGQALPGLAVLRNVSELQQLVKDFKTIDEAKEKETIPTSPPVVNPEVQVSPSPSPSI